VLAFERLDLGYLCASAPAADGDFTLVRRQPTLRRSGAIEDLASFAELLAFMPFRRVCGAEPVGNFPE
jgi:hypothetical protein